MTTKLKSDSAEAICAAVFAGKPIAQLEALAANMLNHALTHPWCDAELRYSIIENICAEYELDCSEVEA